jgi:hypothetical protein
MGESSSLFKPAAGAQDEQATSGELPRLLPVADEHELTERGWNGAAHAACHDGSTCMEGSLLQQEVVAELDDQWLAVLRVRTLANILQQ